MDISSKSITKQKAAAKNQQPSIQFNLLMMILFKLLIYEKIRHQKNTRAAERKAETKPKSVFSVRFLFSKKEVEKI